MEKVLQNKPIRICFVSPKAYPLFNPAVESVFGGAEVDLYMIGTTLAEDSDFNVSFVTADYGQQARESVGNITIIKALSFKESPVAGAIKLWRAMKKADADIYMLKTASPGVPLVWLYCFFHKKKFIYRTAHQDECNGTYSKKHFLAGRAFIFALRRAHAVFTQNIQDRTALLKTANIDSIVVPNVHRPGALQNCTRDIILWVGRSADFKQPNKFIALAGQFPSERFVMICQQASGDTDYQQLMERAAAAANMEFHQRVGFDIIDRFFRRAKVFVNTSTGEGFPNTFIQACQAGAAILSLSVNPDGFLDKNNCGISCGGDERQLAEKLAFLLADNRYIQFGQNGRTHIADSLNISRVICQYKDIFQKIVFSGSGKV